jgi:pyruvate formate-lyase activating enzyme-like uncharacterized protein
MMLEEVLLKAIEAAHSNKAIITIGKGIAADVTVHGCTIKREGRAELLDVLFHASDEQPGDYLTVIPKEDSEVIYGLVENQSTEAVILKCSEIEKVMVKVDTVSYELDTTGHLLKKGNDTAAKILSDFVDEVAKIIVINGRTPDVVKLAAIKSRVNDLYK